ncbi:hypothetical protein BpHYR1_036403 [Brachionus plicatilis]|uniref:Uncharacterized protein n=1 Tax=Brachionus plicatilis TaxID=10195 RepID=A0A3M7T617_BRAPC|nr:hypothetical protein BpHYR1_036403 [Brachionus plicatilis]
MKQKFLNIYYILSDQELVLGPQLSSSSKMYLNTRRHLEFKSKHLPGRQTQLCKKKTYITPYTQIPSYSLDSNF